MGRQEPAPRPRAPKRKGKAAPKRGGGAPRRKPPAGGLGKLPLAFAALAVVAVGFGAHQLLTNRIVPPIPAAGPSARADSAELPTPPVRDDTRDAPDADPPSVPDSPAMNPSAPSTVVAPSSAEPPPPARGDAGGREESPARIAAGTALTPPATPAPAPVSKAALPSVPLPRFPVPPGGPMVAIVLDDVGHDLLFVREAVRRLPKEVVFAVIPHRKNSRECAIEAGRAGFDVICHLPMQPQDGRREEEDHGVVRVGMDEVTVARTVVADVEAVPGAIGVNNHQGSRATQDAGLMETSLRVLRARGLFFIDSRTSPRSVAEGVARRLGIPTSGRDLFLDEDQDPRAIERQVDALVALAKRKGRALGIAHARTSTLDALESALGRAPGEGVRLVGIREYLGITQPAAVRVSR